MPQHAMGWIHQLPDHRDYQFDLAKLPSGPLPPVVDLRGPLLPPVYDQGPLGSCTAQMAAAALDYERAKQGLPFVTPSRLGIYYLERRDQGTVRSDSGATIREAYKVLNTYGVFPESEWPYDIAKFTKAPPRKSLREALRDRVVRYEAVPQIAPFMQQILAARCPIGLGFSVYSSFESDVVARTGVVPMPSRSEQLLGGHAVLIVGYDASGLFPEPVWIVRNSWSAAWGDRGYCYVPFSYFLNPNLASDLWTVELVQAAS